MKFTKLGVVLAAATFAVGAFADAANVLVSFSTTADYYADGTPVLDGEWYALCWSSDGEFDGLTLDCEPVDPSDEVFVLSPLAKGGRCPYVVFQIDSKVAPSGGYYCVYVLDTRNADGTKVASKTVDDSGTRKPAEVNGSKPSKDFAASSVRGVRMKGTEVAGGEWASSTVVLSDEDQPKITAFRVENAKVKVTVSNMLPGLKYNINMGDSPSNLTSYGLDVPKTSDSNDKEFTVDPGDAKFFQVVRQPLDRPVANSAE